MNINDYRRAMDRVTPDIELKERIMNQNQTRSPHISRVLTAALAAALALACLCTVAFAASPELRTAVLSFFRMEEREQVPNGSQTGSQDGPDISQADIGELVKAQYIKMDHHYGMHGDLLNDLTWSEDYRTLLEARFWEVNDSKLVPAEIELNTTKVDITFKDSRYQGEFYWFIRNGELLLLKGEPLGIDIQPEDQWYLDPIPGRTDAVLMRLYQGSQMDYTEYPLLYHLDTGEAEDILANTGAENLELPNSYDWSEDMGKVLIMRSNGDRDRQTWLCDREAGTLSDLRQLTGTRAEIACWADNDTLILFDFSKDEEGYDKTTTGYVYDISTGNLRKTLDQASCFRRWEEEPYGIQFYGPRCLSISQEGQVQIFDLITGGQTILSDFTYDSKKDFMPNPDGNKLLYYAQDPETEGLGISQIGVVDLENGTFIAFDREGYENLREGGIGWSDDSTVSINASTLDGETQYLLLYQF